MKYEVNRVQARKRKQKFSGSDIGQYIASWLDNKRRVVAQSTYTNYRAKARLIDQYFKRAKPETVRKREVKTFLSYLDKHGYSNKTINEYLIILRGVFDDVVEDGLLEKNPATGVQNLTTLTRGPDPFHCDEISAINNACPDFCSEIALFKLGLYTGLRISELLGLAWEDIKLKSREIHIVRAKVQGKLKAPKNRKSDRIIKITEKSVDLLLKLNDLNCRQKPKSYTVILEDNKTQVKEKLRLVFINSNTGKPITNESHYAKYFFKPLLERAGVKYRGPNNTRHTFASQMLTQGAPLAWIAAQLGHSSTAMLFKHYGRYIVKDAPDYSELQERVFRSFESPPNLKVA